MAKSSKPDVDDVADWFINRVDRSAGETITHLALQKLLYFAQAWYLANEGKTLFDEDFQAWAHGPVIRRIFDRFKHLSWDAIPPEPDARELGKEIRRFLEMVYERYGGYGAKRLEKMTHVRGGPWDRTRGDLPEEARCEAVIPRELIKKYYGKKIGKSWA